MAKYLRKAWDAADLRQFDWYTWKAQMEYERGAAEGKHDVTLPQVVHEKIFRDAYDQERARLRGDKPPLPTVDAEKERAKAFLAILEAEKPPAIITPVEAAIFHLRQNRRRALLCLNRPECPSPYFFRTRKGQEYCSAECAKPAQREAKRKWWNEHRAKKGG